MAQIIGFNLRKISISRKEEIKGKIQVKYNIDIKEVNKEKLDLSKDKDVLRFDFKFTINYEPGISDIEFEGNVLTLAEPKDAKEVLKRWKKKELPTDIRLLVFNLILVKCSIKALELEDDLNLPYHLPVPKLAPAQEGKGSSYTG